MALLDMMNWQATVNRSSEFMRMRIVSYICDLEFSCALLFICNTLKQRERNKKGKYKKKRDSSSISNIF